MSCAPKDPNKRGTFGEISVIKDLTSKGYEVFSEVGSSSKIDLIIVDKNYKMHRIQVKTSYKVKNSATLYLVKKCIVKKYNYTYSSDVIDIFALYVIDEDKILYISAKEALDSGRKSRMNFYFGKTKNNQTKKVNNAEDYLDINKIIE
jgi:hypothetical protein